MNRDLVLLLVAFGAVCAAVLGLVEADRGQLILALMFGFHAALLALALARGHRHWLRWYAFLLPVSVLQILPDAMLAGVMGSLRFAVADVPHVGAVPVFMGGLWLIPLLIVGLVADQTRGSLGNAGSTLFAASLGLALFTVSEWMAWHIPIWNAVGVSSTWHVAHYVLLPEAWLCATVVGLERGTRGHGWPTRLVCAPLIALSYAGALAVSYWWLEI